MSFYSMAGTTHDKASRHFESLKILDLLSNCDFVLADTYLQSIVPKTLHK